MDCESLASAVLATLSTFMAKTGEDVATKVGSALYAKMEAVYQAVLSHFAGDNYAEQTLARAESRPESQAAQATLLEILNEKVSEDQAFAVNLQRLLAEVKATGGSQALSLGARSVAIAGDVHGNITTGDVHKAPESRRTESSDE
jgi:hypothetical protein